MPSVTALQMVNRCLRRLRKNIIGDSTTFTSREGIDLLEFVNEAKDDVLETRIWDFDRRQDTLTVYPRIDFPGNEDPVTTSLILINGLVGGAATGGGAPTVNEDSIVRVVATDDSAFPDTSFRLSGASEADPSVLVLPSVWEGGTTSTGYLFIAEYFIPKYALANETGSKYRQILSATHQERELQLVQADRDVSFDGFVQRLHESIGTDPTTMMVGGKGTATTPSGSGGTVGDLMVIWPVPSSIVHLDYTAVLRHPKLVIPEDTLVDVERQIEDVIVSLATALWMQGPGRAAQEGVLLERRTRSRIEDLWHGTRKAPLKRNVLGSLEHQVREPLDNFGRIPRNVGSL
jgi:hypothetical protein